MHKVTKNNQILFVGLESECWEWLLKNQPQSCDWATKHGGYSVKETELSEALKAGVPITSAWVLAQEDLYELQEKFCSSGVPFKYVMTPGEVGWWRHIRGRYGIADWIEENTEEVGNRMVLSFECALELGEVLTEDDMFPKAVMLSDDTALQRLFFWLANEPE